MRFRSSRQRHWIDGLALAALSIAALCSAARIGLAPRAAEQGVAVIYAPWTSPDLAFVRAVGAGARFVRFGGPGFIAVVVPDDPDYSGRALAAGAWLVADPRVIAACLSTFGLQAATR